MQKNSYKPGLRTLPISLALVLTLGACASQPMETIIERDKWQPAEFVSMVTTTPVGVPLVRDCRGEINTESSVYTEFALVKQRNYASKFVHSERYWIVPADGLSGLKVGAEVFVDIKDCELMRFSMSLPNTAQ